jgi:autotransporter-associated beta strand protein
MHKTSLLIPAVCALLAIPASADFTAYNDCTASGGNPANTTLYRGQPDGSGFMKDFTTGLNTPVTLTVASAGLTYVGTGGPMPNLGTDCYNVFNGKVVFDNVAYYGTWMEARFTNLDPNKEYEFVTSVNRGNAGYTTRTTQFTISGVDSATQAGTTGVTVNSPTQVTFCTGANSVNGYVARWTQIKCGADGAFTVRTDNGVGITNGYAMDGIMLKETTPILTPSTSLASGDWHTPGTWDPSGVPTSANPVVVNAHAITITSAAANCNTLTISGSGSVSSTGQILNIANTGISALNTTNGTLILDASSTLNIAKANTSASLAGLTVVSGTILNITNELTVDASKDITGATLNAPKVTLAGGTLTIGAVTVPSGGLISGTGTVAGAVTVASGGKVNPGSDTTIDTITASSLTLDSGSSLTLNAASTSSNDQITVSTGGGLTINGGAITFLNGTGTAQMTDVGTYNLIAYTGAIGGTGVSSLTVANKVPGREYTFGTADGFVTLTLTSVPLTITYVGVDTTTKGDWRTTGVVKPLDPDGDNAYGTDGWMTADTGGGISNPSYATLAYIGGTPDGQNNAYIPIDQPLTPGTLVANETANPRWYSGTANTTEHDLATISLTAASTFRVFLLADIRTDNSAYNSIGYRIRQTTGGWDDSYMQTFSNDNSGGDWHVFEISGVAGDVFTISGRTGPAGENNLTRVGIDSEPSVPVASAASTDWNTTTTWDTLTVPTAVSAVTVNTHAVTIDSAVSTTPATCRSLTLSGGGSVTATNQSLTVAKPLIDALSTTDGTLTLDATSTLNIAKANTSASFAGLMVGSGTILNVSNELTVDTSKNLSGATLNSLKTSLASGNTLTVGALNVPSAGNLTGDGTVAGAVTVAGGGKVSPGASVGTLTVDGLALSAGSLLDFEFNGTPANDQITVNTSGGLTINGGTISLYNEGGTTTFSTAGTYNLFGYSGSIGGAGVSSLTVANKVAGRQYTFGATGTYVTLTIAQGAAWDGGGTTADWSDALNWSGVSPSTGDILPFATAGSGAVLNNNIGGSYASLQFESGAPAFTLNGNAVTLTGDASGNVVLNNSTNTQTVNMPVTLGNNGAINTASNPVAFDSAGTIDNNGKILTVMGTQPVTLGGAMSGIGGVTMAVGNQLYLGANDAVSGTLTINGGTLDNKKGSALTLTNNPTQVWGGDFTFAGTDDLNLGIGAVTLSAAARTVTVNGSKILTIGGPITGAFNLTKTGSSTGTMVISSVGSNFNTLTLTQGTLRLDNSLTASPTMTVTSTSSSNNNGILLDINNFALTTGGINIQRGQVVVRGTSVITNTGGARITGSGDSNVKSFYFQDSSVINGGTGNLETSWTQAAQSYYILMQNSAQATFNNVILGPNAEYADSSGHNTVLEIKDSASLTTPGSLYVLRQANDQNRNQFYRGNMQVYQHGGTVTVGGNLSIAERDIRTNLTSAGHQATGAYNLHAGSVLNLGGRILGGAVDTKLGQAFFNFHGGTLNYTGTSPQTDWINLTVTAGTGGVNSTQNLRIWEGAMIDTGTQDLTVAQALLGPTGQGVSAIDTTGLTATVYTNGCPPWVLIERDTASGDTTGSGASAVPTINAAGNITGFVITNPGNDYTQKPIIRLIRGDFGYGATVPAANITMAANSTYTGGLTKQGLGTLTLKGANTYTGATAVSQGTLALVGGSQKSPITVSSSASLAFDIASPTASTSTYNLSAGTIKIIGTPTLNSYILTTSSGITGTPTLHAPIGGYGLTVDGTTLKLVKSGYASWAGANSISLIPSEDTNNDGVANGVAYFMNVTGLATNPAINGTTKKVTWPNGGNINSDQYGIQFVVQTSSDLQTWTNVLVGDPNLINTSAVVSPPSDGELSYTLTGASPQFARLKVTPN